MNPFQVVREFERELCEYTGAPFAVTTDSCTNAILLAVKWFLRIPLYVNVIPAGPPEIEIPRFTYKGVADSIVHAGGRPVFRDEDWEGWYQLSPLPVWDSARYFSSGMYSAGMLCVSFHATKILGDSHGGAILHDDPEADAWLRRMRFDGRTEGVAPKDDRCREVGHHCYMFHDVASRLRHKLMVLPKHNKPLPKDEYPDLSKLGIYQ